MKRTVALDFLLSVINAKREPFIKTSKFNITKIMNFVCIYGMSFPFDLQVKGAFATNQSHYTYRWHCLKEMNHEIVYNRALFLNNLIPGT